MLKSESLAFLLLSRTTGWGRVMPAGGDIASPQGDATWRGLLCLRKMASAVWGMTQHRDPGSCSFSSLPEPPTPDSLQASLDHSALPLPEPRVTGFTRKFVSWPFKRLSESPEVSPWQTETLLLFTALCHLGSFPRSGTVG